MHLNLGLSICRQEVETCNDIHAHTFYKYFMQIFIQYQLRCLDP